MRFFNTTGPVVPADHYCIPPLERLNLDEILGLVRDKRYFVLHAPRQTGKTSTLLALRDLLNSGIAGEFPLRVRERRGGPGVARGRRRGDARDSLRDGAPGPCNAGRRSAGKRLAGILERAGPGNAFRGVLSRWAEADPKPLVLLIDEIDSLIGDTLLSVLRQLRAGYDQRPSRFPQSVVLCGVRDVRDYRIRSSAENAIVAGGSAFNIKARSLRLGDFSDEDTDTLLAQHTEDTGQAFTPRALETVRTQTGGQPWLVNALAWEACFWHEAGRDRSHAITADDIFEAREQIIERRETHLDQLADKLQEDRVRRVIEPLLSGNGESASSARDIEYVRDLGLVARRSPLRIANPIYAEVVPRELTWAVQETLPQETAWYVDADGGLDVVALLGAFQEFFREHSEHWVERFQYREAGPQLLLQAFLQRIVNGGGRIEREYGLGRMRTDLLLVWPLGGAQAPAGERRATQKVVIECKVLRRGFERTLREGLAQTRAYMDRSGAAQGHLVVFDRTEGRSWEEKIHRRDETEGGVPVTVWGM